jgi:hypothetical protein
MSRVYVQATLPEVQQSTAGKGSWIENVGHFLIKEAELEIGGQRIDRQYGQWMMIWNELAGAHTGEAGFNRMIGNEDVLTGEVTDSWKFKVKNNAGFWFGPHGKLYLNNAIVEFTRAEAIAHLFEHGGLGHATGAYTSKSDYDSGLKFFPKQDQMWKEGTGADGFHASDPAGATTNITGEEQITNDLKKDNAGFVGTPKVFPKRELLIPMNFWFCRNPGLALPLLALQYHEVKVNVTFENFDKLWNEVGADGVVDENAASPNKENLDCKFWVDYIYLDNEERTRMASDQHEYLIEQVQYTGEESCTHSTNRFKLNFNHPCKELVWVVQPSNRRLGDFEYPSGTDNNPVKSAKMTLNGHERFKERPGYYFDCVQPYEHHTRCPPDRGINVYSFALNPEEHQPSGTCNFSRIDNSLLEVKTHVGSGSISDTYYQNAKAHIYATSINSLRIMSGLGGLKFSN